MILCARGFAASAVRSTLNTEPNPTTAVLISNPNGLRFGSVVNVFLLRNALANSPTAGIPLSDSEPLGNTPELGTLNNVPWLHNAAFINASGAGELLGLPSVKK